MRFNGIDGVTFGVSDMAECRRFLDDWGLTPSPEGTGKGTSSTTMDGGEVRLLPIDAPDLPLPFEEGPTLRQVVWGLADAASLVEARSALKDRADFAEGDGWVSVTDPNGMSIKLQVTRRHDVNVSGSPSNTADNVSRVDQRGQVYDRAQPIGIGHVVFFTADIMATLAF